MYFNYNTYQIDFEQNFRWKGNVSYSQFSGMVIK
jgi:hypothetical protein